MNIHNLPNVKEVTNKRLGDVDVGALIEAGEPIILRQAYKDKALVKAGLKSIKNAQDFIRGFYSDAPLTAFMAPPDCKGRFFYKDDISAMNCEASQMSLEAFFECLELSGGRDDKPSYYAGSTDIQTFFPKMIEADNLDLPGDIFKQYPPLMSIWMGNKTTAAIHYDMSHNIAACMVGRRTFTLFPPDQISNLYPGPLFPTPAGQVVSMVDLNDPDFEVYPDFKKALSTAQIAKLEPGDVLIYPAMWWHQVEAQDDFNVLINYWWNEAPRFMDSPMNSVFYAMLALRDRSPAEKAAWKNIFDYYVFGDAEQPRSHLPDVAYGPLGPMDIQTSRRLRQMLINKLNR